MTKEDIIKIVENNSTFDIDGSVKYVDVLDYNKLVNELLQAINYKRCSTELPTKEEINSEIVDILGRYKLGAKPTPTSSELNGIEKGFRICIEWIKTKAIT